MAPLHTPSGERGLRIPLVQAGAGHAAAARLPMADGENQYSLRRNSHPAIASVASPMMSIGQY